MAQGRPSGPPASVVSRTLRTLGHRCSNAGPYNLSLHRRRFPACVTGPGLGWLGQYRAGPTWDEGEQAGGMGRQRWLAIRC